MKFLIECLVGTGMLTFFLITPQANGMPPNSTAADIRPAQTSAVVHQTMARISPKPDKAVRLERALVRDVRKDKWWMLFVGITVVGYRLLRKHQSLFGNSLLYASYGDIEQRTISSMDSLTSDMDEPVTARMVNAS